MRGRAGSAERTATMLDPVIATSFTILGTTTAGRAFRPSDWAERLCGVMAQFRPPGMAHDRVSYSPYVMPGLQSGVKTVRVDARIYAVEPKAYHFLRGFAADNALQVVEQTTGAGGTDPSADTRRVDATV